jgi:hypothetical protein
MKKKKDREEKTEKKLKKKIMSHIEEDDKDFRKQIADDVKLKKVVKKKLR